MKRYPLLMKCVAILGFYFFGCTLTGAAEVIDYAKGVLPIMKEHCWDCHSNEKSVKGSLALDDLEEVRDYQIGKFNIIRPGDVAESVFFERLMLDSTHNDFMPRKGSPLPKSELAIIEKWIAQGAIVDVSKMTEDEQKRFSAAKAARGSENEAPAGAAFHQWTNLTGKVIEAQMMALDEDSVKLRLKSGKTFDVQLKDLAPGSVSLARELGEK